MNIRNLINEMISIIDNVNYQFVADFISDKNNCRIFCVQPSITYDAYFRRLKKEWEDIINHGFRDLEECKGIIPKIGILTNVPLIHSPEEIDREFLKKILVAYAKSQKEIFFVMSENLMETLHSFWKLVLSNPCYILSILKYTMHEYYGHYINELSSENIDDIIQFLQVKFDRIIQLFQGRGELSIENVKADISNRLSVIASFGVEDELNRLVPNSFGSLKPFFIKIIVVYYRRLHPIVWINILRNILHDIFQQAPMTEHQLFSFLSKHFLLNSGPFILKILQMIRPFLTDDIARKYNIYKLTYPLMDNNQVEMTMKKIINSWSDYRIVTNRSASVAHVCIIARIDNPNDISVVKIIKPISAAQSCWEYQTLKDIFEKGTCQREFMKNILISNGRELNTKNEINNIAMGEKAYTGSYHDVFGIDVPANIGTVKVKDDILVGPKWFAFAMTLAPGVPISHLVENKLLEHDTKFRSRLHRCLDLLVSKFITSLVKTGFYHGDLHSGNIFFSYQDKMLTLIDFGSAGKFDLTSKDDDMAKVLEIIIMSIYYNFDQILDELTIMLNKKCESRETIDMHSNEYLKFREQLTSYKIRNILFDDENQINSQKKNAYIFGKDRVELEKDTTIPTEHDERTLEAYRLLELQNKQTDYIVENRDVIQDNVHFEDRNLIISFQQVLLEMIKFYSANGLNVPIKFSEFYEFQKAYNLLLGVLTRTKYSSSRLGFVINKSVVSWEHIGKVFNISLINQILTIRNREMKKYKDMKSKLSNEMNRMISENK